MFLLCAPEPGKMLMNHMSNFDVDESKLINGCRALAHLAANLMEFPLKVCCPQSLGGTCYVRELWPC
jgi:hypothetical protein